MREINRKEIQSMDTPNLTKMRNIIRDKWTWETGSDRDKEFLDFIEAELSSREDSAISPEPYFKIIGECIKFNDSDLFYKSSNYQNPVELSEELSKTIRKMICKSIDGYSYISYNDGDIANALIQKINSEIHTMLRPTLETLIKTIILSELTDLEDRLRTEFQRKLKVLKFELQPESKK